MTTMILSFLSALMSGVLFILLRKFSGKDAADGFLVTMIVYILWRIVDSIRGAQ